MPRRTARLVPPLLAASLAFGLGACASLFSGTAPADLTVAEQAIRQPPALPVRDSRTAFEKQAGSVNDLLAGVPGLGRFVPSLVPHEPRADAHTGGPEARLAVLADDLYATRTLVENYLRHAEAVVALDARRLAPLGLRPGEGGPQRAQRRRLLALVGNNHAALQRAERGAMRDAAAFRGRLDDLSSAYPGMSLDVAQRAELDLALALNALSALVERHRAALTAVAA